MTTLVTSDELSRRLADRNIANLIGDSELREATFRKIASRASVTGESRLAVQTIHYIRGPSERAMTLDSVATTLASGVSPADAMDVVEDLESRRLQVRFLVAVAGRKS
ncbi:MAG: hypothetical protein OSA93_07115 [Akkermansiaceae bacterium]|jgi:hypothetical protein|nr:hypothetical protein [Akkermansiaceae bacterium]